MKVKIFAVQTQTIAVDLALLLLRLVCGCAFVLHGWGKIQNPLHWMGNQSNLPGVLQALAAIAEFGGGIALILGLLTRLAALGLTLTMMVAVLMHHIVLDDPFVNPTGGRSYEPALVYLVIALLLMMIGPGRFSLDRKIFGAKN